jgi:hypothetical protein
MEKLADVPGATVVSHEPSITLALDSDCRVQCRLSVENRTNAYQIRTGDYPEEQLSVYLTARQYGSLPPDMTFVQSLENLTKVCRDMVDNYVIDNVLRPLARAIALR